MSGVSAKHSPKTKKDWELFVYFDLNSDISPNKINVRNGIIVQPFLLKILKTRYVNTAIFKAFTRSCLHIDGTLFSLFFKNPVTLKTAKGRRVSGELLL